MNDTLVFWTLVFIAILLALSAFFSMSEAALLALGGHHLRKLRSRGRRASSALEYWFRNSKKVLTACLVGNNIVNTLAAVLAASFAYSVEHHIGVFAVTGIMTFLVLVFGEVFPKSLGRRFSEQIAAAVIVPLRALTIVLGPLNRLLLLMPNLVLRRLGGDVESIIPGLTEDDLKAMIAAGEEEGVIEAEEGEMIHSIFELGETAVREIMVPRVRIAGVEEGAPAADVLGTVVKTGFSRLPVFQGSIDRITGVVYVKDLLARTVGRPEGEAAPSARDCMRAPFFVPEAKTVLGLMEELQNRKLQMAIVVDEYGGTAGVVTMEDLVEEIVGEISDEYGQEAQEIQRNPDGSFLARGSVEIEKANERLHLGIPEGRDETLGGFLLRVAGRIPAAGESFVHGAFVFRIERADAKRVLWVSIRRAVEPGEGHGPR